MKRKLTVVLCLLAAIGVFGQINRPKLVVGLVVDQMRWDYLYYYYDQYRKDGLRTLVDHGFSFENTLINYLPAVTAVGHSSIYTGSVPALTGIVSNNFYLNGKWTYCCDDPNVKSVGSNSKEGMMSPRNLLATGLGDMLKIATNFNGKVIGVALKDRAAIMPAGHGADAAYWWDTSAGHFVTSTYYMNELPAWVKETNKRIGTKPKTNIKTAVVGVTKTFQMAEAALENEHLGQDSITDLLTISVSSTDAISHVYGTRGKENHDAYMELDNQLAQFIKTLDEKVGKGQWLMFLSADHGGSHNHNFLKAHHIPAGGLDLRNTLKPYEAQLEQELGFAPVIKKVTDGWVYINKDGAAKAGKQMSDVKAAVCATLQQNDSILYAVDCEKALTTTVPQPIREMIVNGYRRGRSGEVFIVPKAGWENMDGSDKYIGTTHQEWNPYDTHIPFVLYGWNVPHGQTSAAVHITDIAPTICAMLHIQMPNSCVGTSRSDYLKR